MKEKEKGKKRVQLDLWTCSQELRVELISTHHLFVEILSDFILWKEKKEGTKKNHANWRNLPPFPRLLLTHLPFSETQGETGLGCSCAGRQKGGCAGTQGRAKDEGRRQNWAGLWGLNWGAFGPILVRWEKTAKHSRDRPAGQGRQLSVVACTPSAIGALGSPDLVEGIMYFGWRVGGFLILYIILFPFSCLFLPPSKEITPTRLIPLHDQIARCFGSVFLGVCACDGVRSLRC